MGNGRTDPRDTDRQHQALPQHFSEWWLKHWTSSTLPAAKMQLAWMEAIGELISMESEFLSIYASSGKKAAQLSSQPQAVRDPIAFSRRYGEIAQEIADAHIQRLNRVSQLSEDFRLQLWEEI